MRKYHGYSVKTTLESHFGKDPLGKMREEHERWIDANDENAIIPHAWEQADERMLFLCQAEYYLLDTRLYDDFVAYIVQEKRKKIAILAFLRFDDQPFQLDSQYAWDLTCQWEQKGYDVLLARVNLKLKRQNGVQGEKLIEIEPIASRAGAVELLRVKSVSGRHIIVCEEPQPCWVAIKRNFACAVQRGNEDEYECLFSEDVCVYEKGAKDQVELANGYYNVLNHLDRMEKPTLVYAAAKGDSVYTRTVIAGNLEITFDLNETNQINAISERKINVERLEIIQTEDVPGTDLLEQIPEIMAIRPLDPAAVHAYAIQIDFSDDSVRNYYIATFDTPEMPEIINVEGHWFTRDTIKTFSIRHNDFGYYVRFDNDFPISDRKLYYRSYVQLTPEQREGDIYQKNGIRIVRKHRTPLMLDWHRGGPRYFGSDAELFGPSNTFLSADGDRLSPVSYWEKWDSFGLEDIALVTAEPSGKAGYIRKVDGSWLFPPVYEVASQFKGCAVAQRRVHGELAQFLLTYSGEEIPWEHHLDNGYFSEGMCPFSVIPPEYDKDRLPSEFDDLECGMWGYINTEGRIVVDPQYAYATGFDGGYAFVAKRVDNILRWGAIAPDGHEILPCIYKNLYTRWGNVFHYQVFDNELIGLMDLAGNVILEPKFSYIDKYDDERRLVSCGEYEDACGVYSIDLNKMIVPPKYDCIDFEKDLISAEIALTGNEVYFDYDGNELSFGDYERVYEPYNKPGYLTGWKDGKCALLKMDGTVLVPLSDNNGNNFDYYEQGLLITGSKERLGLSRISGEVILPKRYSKITVCGEFVIASLQAQHAGSVSDELYTLDGDLILGGAYRNITIHDSTMKAETPNGIEFYKITRSEGGITGC